MGFWEPALPTALRTVTTPSAGFYEVCALGVGAECESSFLGALGRRFGNQLMPRGVIQSGDTPMVCSYGRDGIDLLRWVRTDTDPDVGDEHAASRWRSIRRRYDPNNNYEAPNHDDRRCQRAIPRSDTPESDRYRYWSRPQCPPARSTTDRSVGSCGVGVLLGGGNLQPARGVDSCLAGRWLLRQLRSIGTEWLDHPGDEPCSCVRRSADDGRLFSGRTRTVTRD